MTDNKRFLFEELDVLREYASLPEVPDHILSNLNRNISLRPYQVDAFSNTLEYLTNLKLSRNKQTWLLYHMATGSGKTVMMAGLILHYYTLGYRNFIFFVNQNNIIAKTKVNFLDRNSSKYLFNDVLEIEGRNVPIKEVSNFASSDPNAINICFTTVQGLHKDFFHPKENSLTVDDFEDAPVVMISDEAHHVNSRTKKANKAEAEADRSWEHTVMQAFSSNRDNVLLEFTATTDLRDPNIAKKYIDKIVFDYPLAKFRDSGYTKDFRNLQSTHGLWERTLQALVMSEYRRSVFADIGIEAKPVVLLKSQFIKDSENFYKEFFASLSRLSEDEIRTLKDDGPISEALDHFEAKDPTLRSLRRSLQSSFAEDNAIIMNGNSDTSVEKQLAVNSLEDAGNPYRIIFTVDMLNEGWDVLNLYDIVRLNETRQGGPGGRPGPYTIKEAQLIGRGARYFPFIAEDEATDRDPDEAGKRKYDSDTASPRRMLETLLYHSKQDSRYINELRLALKENGLLPDETTEITYTLKQTFKESSFFHEARVFSNKREEVSRQGISGLDNRIKSATYSVDARRGSSTLHALFGEETLATAAPKATYVHTKIKDLPPNVTLGTLATRETLRFDVLKHYFPSLESSKEFMTDEHYLGDVEIVFATEEGSLTGRDLMAGVNHVLDAVSAHIQAITITYRGSDAFEGKRLSEVLRDKTVQVTHPVANGIGTSQSNPDDANYVNLTVADWFSYQDNFGTSEEKAFVKYFSTIVDELKTEYDEVYLIRNERIADLAIYSFDTGERFEPDFLLLLRNKGQQMQQEQIYVEPKGSNLLQTDAWKQRFLLEIQDRAIPYTTYVDNTKYRIVGLPFFNTEHDAQEFREAFREATGLK